jgi:hypothetical protein
MNWSVDGDWKWCSLIEPFAASIRRSEISETFSVPITTYWSDASDHGDICLWNNGFPLRNNTALRPKRFISPVCFLSLGWKTKLLARWKKQSDLENLYLTFRGRQWIKNWYDCLLFTEPTTRCQGCSPYGSTCATYYCTQQPPYFSRAWPSLSPDFSPTSPELRASSSRRILYTLRRWVQMLLCLIQMWL